MSERCKNGKIYKVVNDLSDDFYVGSTCTTLAKRKWKHKCHMREKLQIPFYDQLT